MGLRVHPKLNKIIELAGNQYNPKIRDMALRYFLSNFEVAYAEDYYHYNYPKTNIEFLPCSDPSIYAKPSECFISPECDIMKFRVVHQDLQFAVEKIGVRQHPDHNQLINRLTENPARDKNKAKAIFEYLATQQGNFTHSNWNSLFNLKFIPVQDKIRPDIMTLTSPRNCFFKMEEELYVYRYSLLFIFSQIILKLI